MNNIKYKFAIMFLIACKTVYWVYCNLWIAIWQDNPLESIFRHKSSSI